MTWLQTPAGAQVEKPGPETQSKDSLSSAEHSKATGTSAWAQKEAGTVIFTVGPLYFGRYLDTPCSSRQ